MAVKNVGKQLVGIVEELALCQKELVEGGSFGESSAARLENLTIELAKIAEKLFQEWKKEEFCGFFSPKKDNVKQLVVKDMKDNIRKHFV